MKLGWITRACSHFENVIDPTGGPLGHGFITTKLGGFHKSMGISGS